jgi:hypothetical protein
MTSLAEVALPDELRRRASTIEATVDKVFEMTCTQGCWIVGSLASGLSHAYSDIDIYALCDCVAGHAVQVYQEGSERIDIEWKSAHYLLECAALFDGYTMTGTNVLEQAHSEKVWDDVVRILCGVAVSKSREFDHLDRQLRDRRDNVRKSLVSYRVWESLGKLEDLYGFAADRDRESAQLLMHELELRGLEILTAGFGDLYIGRKWLAQKLRRLGLVDFGAPILAPSTLDLGERADRVQRIFSVAQLAAGGRIDVPRARQLLYRASASRPDGLVRAPNCYPFVTAEGTRLCLIPPGAFDPSEILVANSVLALWTCFDGDVQGSVQLFADLFGGGHEKVKAAARLQVEMLKEHGVLVADAPAIW